MHKNLNRYAEDSLDARLRQVSEQVDLRAEPDAESYNTINMSNGSRGARYNAYRKQRDEQQVQVPIQPHHLI